MVIHIIVVRYRKGGLGMNKIDFTILDPMGNLTALVITKTPKGRRTLVTKKIMNQYPKVEQVGFVNSKNFERRETTFRYFLTSFEMMGGELSINGTLAAGYYLSQRILKQVQDDEERLNSRLPAGKAGFRGNDMEINFTASGVPNKVTYFLKKNLPTISLSIPYQILKIEGFNFVDLGEIGYFIVKNDEIAASLAPRNDDFVKLFEKFREKFEKKLNRNAWGVVFYKDNRIWPVVYVKDKKGKTLEKRLEMACGSGSLVYSIISGKEKIIQPSGEIIYIEKGDTKFEISGKVKMCYDERSLYVTN